LDWFERLTGFQETDYDDTRARLAVDRGRLKSLVNGKSYGVGELELASLKTLRQRAKSVGGPSGRLKVSLVTGDVREMHRQPEYASALFQVASQFNLLEMTGPNVTPEDGVTIYQYDRTQGPACAIASGAATIYRNYFAKVGGAEGQTKKRQLDGLADIGTALSEALGLPVESFWEMKNGYAQCSQSGLNNITEHIRSALPGHIEMLRGNLRIGLHTDVEVTDARDKHPAVVVSQAFCSALPVSYNGHIPSVHWKAFSSLVLEAAYEATMWAAVLNAQRGASNIVLLTSLGGGAFGNDETWINGALRRALQMTTSFGLDVRLVSFGAPTRGFADIAKAFDP
jgi:hypothetical protein